MSIEKKWDSIDESIQSSPMFQFVRHSQLIQISFNTITENHWIDFYFYGTIVSITLNRSVHLFTRFLFCFVLCALDVSASHIIGLLLPTLPNSFMVILKKMRTLNSNLVCVCVCIHAVKVIRSRLVNVTKFQSFKTRLQAVNFGVYLFLVFDFIFCDFLFI